MTEADGARERGNPSAPRKILEATQRLLRQRDLRVVLLCSAVLGLAVSFVLPFLSLFGTQAVGMSLGAFGAFMTTTALSNIALSTVLAQQCSKATSLLARTSDENLLAKQRPGELRRNPAR